MSEKLDIAIIGGGPAGLAAGIQAARRGLRHVVLERGEIADTIFKYQKGKLVMAEPPRLRLHEDLPMRFEESVREDILSRWQEDITEAGVELRKGPEFEVMSITGEKGDFSISLKNGQTLNANAVVLAIGLQGNIRTFGVPGDDMPHVAYQLDDPAEHVGKRVAVVGAGDAGIENALGLAEHDNEVSILNRGREFDRAKPANRSKMEAAIRQGSISHIPSCNVDHFEENCVFVQTENGDLRLDTELVIGRLGAIPPRRFMEDIGIQFESEDREAVAQVSATYESNVPGIHLIGALAGYPLIKNCINQGFEVVEFIQGNEVVPADEPVLREVFGDLEGSVNEIIERIKNTLPLFASLTTIQLREFLVDAKVHRVAAGEVIYERNDFSDSFYSILAGTAAVSLPVDDSDADSDLKSEEKRERIAYLETGDFFGEGSLMSGRRRAGTVSASTDCVLIESPRYSMNRLIKSVPEVKRELDRTYIRRRLGTVFPDSSQADRDELARHAKIMVYRQGEELFKEGDAPDGLHLIRRGAVTISKMRAGREVTVNYVQAGNYVGEVAIVDPEARRTATVRASVLTETVLLPTVAIAPFLADHRGVRVEFDRRREEYLVSDVAITSQEGAPDLLRTLMDAGFGEATDLLVIDESLCIRCDNCETACADTHEGVSRLDREAGPRFANVHIPTACRHCENPKCMTDCPPDALRRHSNGEVYIMDNCIGCGNCADHCPYEVIQMAAVDEPRRPSLLFRLLFGMKGGGESKTPGTHAAKKAVKCDLCRKLPPPRPGETRASCVSACPTGAIVRVNPRSYVESIRGGEDTP